MASAIGNMFLLSASCPKKIICSTMMKNGQNVFLIISLDFWRCSVLCIVEEGEDRKRYTNSCHSGRTPLLFGARNLSKRLDTKQSPETREFWILWKTWNRKTADPLRRREGTRWKPERAPSTLNNNNNFLNWQQEIAATPAKLDVCLHSARNKSFRQRGFEFSLLIGHFLLSRCFYQIHVCFACLRWLNSSDNDGDVSFSWSKPHVSIDGQSIIVSGSARDWRRCQNIWHVPAN